MEFKELVKVVRWCALNDEKPFEKDIATKAADNLEALAAERDQAVKDIETILNTIEEIRNLELILDGDLDDALGEVCEKYCVNCGKGCFVHGDEPHSCKNWCWRGVGRQDVL